MQFVLLLSSVLICSCHASSKHFVHLKKDAFDTYELNEALPSLGKSRNRDNFEENPVVQVFEKRTKGWNASGKFNPEFEQPFILHGIASGVSL